MNGRTCSNIHETLVYAT